MKEIVLDTETTGLSVENGHRIVEIGCIELKDQILTSNRFHSYLNPQRKVSEEAFKVHGYSDEFLSDKKKFAEIVDDFNFDHKVSEWDLDCVHVWRSRNPINDLLYGYGGAKLFKRSKSIVGSSVTTTELAALIRDLSISLIGTSVPGQ